MAAVMLGQKKEDERARRSEPRRGRSEMIVVLILYVQRYTGAKYFLYTVVKVYVMYLLSESGPKNGRTGRLTGAPILQGRF